MLVLSQAMYAQDYSNYLQKARQRIAEGDCDGAQRCYNVYKDLTNKTDKDVERQIRECKGDTGGDNTSTYNGHGYVDLGLPSGTLWATCNVGATTPEGYGYYFAWGETKSKTTYNWDTYKYCNGGHDQLTKYCNFYKFGYQGFTDNLTVLQPVDDAATANWGSGWCMPTKEQWEELYKNTDHSWKAWNGVNGRLFKGKNGAVLFLPAAGYRWDDELNGVGDYGRYWSSSLYTDNPDNAWGFDFNSDDYGMDYYDHLNGRSVRAVRSARQN